MSSRFRETKSRRCLQCGEMFLSSWGGHRRCPKCARRIVVQARRDALTTFWANLILSHLYDDRHSREQIFGDSVNHVQGLLLGDVKLEDMTETKRVAFEHVLCDLLIWDWVSDSRAKDITKRLMQAGWDVFREMR